MLGSQFIRKSLKTSNFETAIQTIRQWEGKGQVEAKTEGPVKVEDAVKGYLEDTKARNLGEATLTKLETIFEKQFLTFCTANGFQFLTQVADVNVIRQFRSTWKDAPLSRGKKQSRVIGFFYFCERTGWLHKNPVTNRVLGRIKVEQKPTDYFNPAEFEAIVDATFLYCGDRWEKDTTAGARLRALTLLMRWTGLRIRDASTLERERLTKTDRGGDCVLLYQAKTGEPVYCPIPPHVAEALRNVPDGLRPNPRYFFWSGNGHPKTVVADFQRSYRRLFKLAEITKRAQQEFENGQGIGAPYLFMGALWEVNICACSMPKDFNETPQPRWTRHEPSRSISNKDPSQQTLEHFTLPPYSCYRVLQ